MEETHLRLIPVFITVDVDVASPATTNEGRWLRRACPGRAKGRQCRPSLRLPARPTAHLRNSFAIQYNAYFHRLCRYGIVNTAVLYKLWC